MVAPVFSVLRPSLMVSVLFKPSLDSLLVTSLLLVFEANSWDQSLPQNSVQDQPVR